MRRTCYHLARALVVIAPAGKICIFRYPNSNPVPIRLKSAFVFVKEWTPIDLTCAVGAVDVDGDRHSIRHANRVAHFDSGLCTDCIPCTCANTSGCADRKCFSPRLRNLESAAIWQCSNVYRCSRLVAVNPYDYI